MQMLRRPPIADNGVAGVGNFAVRGGGLKLKRRHEAGVLSFLSGISGLSVAKAPQASDGKHAGRLQTSSDKALIQFPILFKYAGGGGVEIFRTSAYKVCDRCLSKILDVYAKRCRNCLETLGLDGCQLDGNFHRAIISSAKYFVLGVACGPSSHPRFCTVYLQCFLEGDAQ